MISLDIQARSKMDSCVLIDFTFGDRDACGGFARGLVDARGDGWVGAAVGRGRGRGRYFNKPMTGDAG